MMGGSYLGALRMSFLPEWLSMNAMMAGMFPVMVVLMMGRDMRAMEPSQLLHWGTMSAGVIVGFFTALPVNAWLVAMGLKHGMGTDRSGAEKGRETEDHRTEDHGGMDHGGMMDMERKATSPQTAVVAVLSSLALAGAFVFCASYANLTLGAKDVGGLVMPPGMIMTRETSADAMRDMAAVDRRYVAYQPPPDARGDQLLQPRLEGGVKVFDLETSVARWNILPETRVAAYAFNGQIPGPRIRVAQGDRLRINLTNRLPESTTVHWHGLILPNAMDGPAEITQAPIQPGQTFTYEFEARQVGTFFYHSHDHVDRQQALGLYGALIVDPLQPPAARAWDHELLVQLQEWLHRDGYTYPAMPMEGALPNFFTINGKAFPETETLRMRVGERVLVRFIGSSSAFIHPMHIHGGPFRIVATDGESIAESAQLLKDTVNVAPGERYDVIWEAREPGKWLLHCHINHHVTNDNREQQGGGGLMLILDVM
jgi:FtsP/CotA-like multicopper oxidase with cupredoxin domain